MAQHKNRWSWLVFVWLLSLIWLPATSLADDPRGIEVTLGKQQVVFPNGYRGLQYFPDVQMSLLNTKPVTFLVVASESTYLMQGRTLEAAVPIKKVLAPGDKTSFDNGYAGISSTYIDKGKNELLGFYHAEDHVGMPKPAYNPDLKGAYWTVALAVSKDGGQSFAKIGPILTCSITKDKATRETQGVATPSIVNDPTNTYLYAYYTDLTRRKDRFSGSIALARSRISDGGRPGTWFKYHRGEFSEKGLGGEESPVVEPPPRLPSDIVDPHVTWIPAWKKYVMFCTVNAYGDFEKKKAEQGGIFYCSSDDGIKWTEPKRLIVAHAVPFLDREYVAHPCLHVEKVESDKATGWLFYCYSPRWGTAAPRQPHHLARRAVTLTNRP